MAAAPEPLAAGDATKVDWQAIEAFYRQHARFWRTAEESWRVADGGEGGGEGGVATVGVVPVPPCNEPAMATAEGGVVGPAPPRRREILALASAQQLQPLSSDRCACY